MRNESRDEHFPEQGVSGMCTCRTSREEQHGVPDESVGKTVQLGKKPERLACNVKRRQIFMNL